MHNRSSDGLTHLLFVLPTMLLLLLLPLTLSSVIVAHNAANFTFTFALQFCCCCCCCWTITKSAICKARMHLTRLLPQLERRKMRWAATTTSRHIADYATTTNTMQLHPITFKFRLQGALHPFYVRVVGSRKWSVGVRWRDDQIYCVRLPPLIELLKCRRWLGIF